jgi:alkyl sulfatase BDS1-like metallo-beta-lactamase superfamily hydrolase
VLATPGGEGDDGISLWLPDERMLFSGDLFSVAIPSWPNLFPLRGTRFRDPLPMLDTIESLIELAPEWVFPGHFEPMRGSDRIREAFVHERDAIRYVVDRVIAGLNDGLDVYEMMKLELPTHLDVPQTHGKVSWSVRGLAEALGGWFHHDSTAALYPVPPRAVSPALVELAGGIDAFIERAQRFSDAKQPIHALHLLEIAAGAAPDDARLHAALSKIYRALLSDATNYNERAWLEGRLALTEATSEEAVT